VVQEQCTICKNFSRKRDERLGDKKLTEETAIYIA
jgi:hypothetical protein